MINTDKIISISGMDLKEINELTSEIISIKIIKIEEIIQSAINFANIRFFLEMGKIYV